MKNVILSADGDQFLYSVPDPVAEHLEKYCMEFLHCQMVAVAHHRQNGLHMMALCKLGVRTLRKAVANHAVFRVIGIRAHAEGSR